MFSITHNVVHVARGDIWSDSERRLLHLLRALNSRGDIRLHVILVGSGRGEEEMRAAGLPIDLIANRRQTLTTTLIELRRHLHAQKPQTIHSHHRELHVAVTLAAVGLNVAKLRSFQNAVSYSGWRRNAEHWLEKLASRFYDAAVAYSPEVAQEAQRWMPWLRVQLIESGIDIDEVRAASTRHMNDSDLGEGVRVAFVGDLVQSLRPDLFLATAHCLGRDTPGLFSFHLFGSGDLQLDCERFIYRHSLQERIRLMGDRGDVRPWLSQMHALVITSNCEGGTTTMLEAMALGVPVIAPAFGDTSRILGYGRYGFLVRDQSPAAYAEALLNTVNRADDTSELTRRAQRFAESHYSANLSARRHLELYGSLRTKPSSNCCIVYD